MLIKTKPTGIAISKKSCKPHCMKDIKNYLLKESEKGSIDLTINKDWFVIESTPHTLYTILFTLSMSYDIELM